MNTDDSTPPDTETAANQINPVTQAWEATRDKAGEVFDSGEHYVRENPGTAVLSIFGIGLVVGMVVGWSCAHER